MNNYNFIRILVEYGTYLTHSYSDNRSGDRSGDL